MCEFCIKHGEGKKWYEIMENYSREFMEEESRKAYIRSFVPNVRGKANSNIEKLAWAKKRVPLAERLIRNMGTRRMKNKHFGQVIPLEDAVNVVTMVQSITRVACICRNVATGSHNSRYCLLLGVDPTGMLGDWPEARESLETLHVREAVQLLEKFDMDGLVHSIWTFETPFIGAICNCDRDCLAYRIQVKENLFRIMFKAEYVARIEALECSGCKKCMDYCQFHALEYSRERKKCSVNPFTCYGCGVCRSACKTGAISLLDRGSRPHLREVW